MYKTFVALIAASFLSACAQTTFHFESLNDALLPSLENNSHYFISGVGQRKDYDAAAVCGGRENVVKVQTRTTFINGLVGVITFGIYTPQQYRIYCRESPS